MVKAVKYMYLYVRNPLKFYCKKNTMLTTLRILFTKLFRLYNSAL